MGCTHQLSQAQHSHLERHSVLFLSAEVGEYWWPRSRAGQTIGSSLCPWHRHWELPGATLSDALTLIYDDSQTLQHWRNTQGVWQTESHIVLPVVISKVFLDHTMNSKHLLPQVLHGWRRENNIIITQLLQSKVLSEYSLVPMMGGAWGWG